MLILTRVLFYAEPRNDYFKYCCLLLIGDRAACLATSCQCSVCDTASAPRRTPSQTQPQRRQALTKICTLKASQIKHCHLCCAPHPQDPATPTWAVFAVTTVLRCCVTLAQTQDSYSFLFLTRIHCAGSCQHWRCPEPVFHEAHSFSASSSSDGSSFPLHCPWAAGSCQIAS